MAAGFKCCCAVCAKQCACGLWRMSCRIVNRLKKQEDDPAGSPENLQRIAFAVLNAAVALQMYCSPIPAPTPLSDEGDTAFSRLLFATDIVRRLSPPKRRPSRTASVPAAPALAPVAPPGPRDVLGAPFTARLDSLMHDFLKHAILFDWNMYRGLINYATGLGIPNQSLASMYQPQCPMWDTAAKSASMAAFVHRFTNTEDVSKLMFVVGDCVALSHSLCTFFKHNGTPRPTSMCCLRLFHLKL